MRLLITYLAGAVFASSALADCRPADLAGDWNLFVDEYACSITVNADGATTRGQCTRLREPGAKRNATSTVAGQLNLKADCRVVGFLDRKVPLTGDDKWKVHVARMQMSGQAWYGQIWISDRAKNFPLQAVRVQ